MYYLISSFFPQNSYHTHQKKGISKAGVSLWTETPKSPRGGGNMSPPPPQRYASVSVDLAVHHTELAVITLYWRSTCGGCGTSSERHSLRGLFTVSHFLSGTLRVLVTVSSWILKQGTMLFFFFFFLTTYHRWKKPWRPLLFVCVIRTSFHLTFYF